MKEVAGGLGGDEEAEEVGAEDFVEVGWGMAAGEERGGDFGQVGGGVDALGERADSVEVGTDADVIDARDRDDVVEVGDEGRERRAGKARGEFAVEAVGDMDTGRACPWDIRRRVFFGAAKGGFCATQAWRYCSSMKEE